MNCRKCKKNMHITNVTAAEEMAYYSWSCDCGFTSNSQEIFADDPEPDKLEEP